MIALIYHAPFHELPLIISQSVDLTACTRFISIKLVVDASKIHTKTHKSGSKDDGPK